MIEKTDRRRAIVFGLCLGLVLSFLFGPTNNQNSQSYTFINGLVFALGIALISDFYVLVSFGISISLIVLLFSALPFGLSVCLQYFF